MKILLGGLMESSLIREITREWAPERLNTTHTYYLSLQRSADQSILERIGTFAAIADQIQIAPVDWTPQMGADESVDLAPLGLTRLPYGVNEWDEDAATLAGIILYSSALSTESLRLISFHDAPQLEEKGTTAYSIKLFGEVNWYAYHYLCRLFAQLRSAQADDSYLSLTEPEQKILSEIAEFIGHEGLPTPFDIPDVHHDDHILSEQLGGGLLNFSPPDIQSMMAVRNDSTVRSYASVVREILTAHGGADREQELLKAMINAKENFDTAGRTLKVFEFNSWFATPLSLVPGLGTISTALSFISDVLTMWAQRRQTSEGWYMLRSRMSDVALNDYLVRKSNLYTK